jgi:hypothetical protein
MTEDPIIEEVRRAREELLAKFNYDLIALVKHLQEKTEEARRAGRKVMSLPPKRVTPQSSPAKKLG